MNTEKSLEKIGLTPNEIKIYKYLLRKGLSTGTQIYVETLIDKSSAYRAIDGLQRKGLAYSIGETRNQKFNAHPAETLLDLHKAKIEDLESTRDDINLFITDIGKYAKDNYKSNRISLFEGEEGFKLFMEDRIKGKVDLIRQLAPLKERVQYTRGFYEYMEDFVKRRVEKKIPARVLFDITVETDNLDRTRPDILKEARQIPEEFNLKATVVTFGDRSGLYTQEDGKFMGIRIHDRLITHLMNAMYDFIWDRSKDVY